MIPSPFPLYDFSKKTLTDGISIAVSSYCKNSINSNAMCAKHYATIEAKEAGYFQCPFGFTTRTFNFGKQNWAVTGVIAFPRFDTTNERQMAKRFPEIKTSRNEIEKSIEFLKQVDTFRADAIEDASKVLPQAFHELRKLNGAVLQHSEKEIADRGESRNLLSIKSAAELMRNNFDILEALSNIEGIKLLPNDSTINIFDLVFKMKRVYQEKAADKNMSINVSGVRAISSGSQKSFPIVPAVLLENAIKYGKPNTVIRADISARNGRAFLTIENQTEHKIDVNKCFDRGARYASDVEGGGFGLFLAKEVVNCHGGTIRCEATAGSVKMIVDLPLSTIIAQPA